MKMSSIMKNVTTYFQNTLKSTIQMSKSTLVIAKKELTSVNKAILYRLHTNVFFNLWNETICAEYSFLRTTTFLTMRYTYIVCCATSSYIINVDYHMSFDVHTHK